MDLRTLELVVEIRVEKNVDRFAVNFNSEHRVGTLAAG
jgi:hypothetical protein